MAWKRPDSSSYPSVWVRFQGKPHGDQEPIQYKVQDLTENYYEKAIEHMTRYFLIQESLCSSNGFIEDEESVKEIQDLWRNLVKQNMALICLAIDPETGKDKIAGVNMTMVSEKNDSDINFNGKLMKRIWACLSHLQSDVDVFEKYNTNVYMSALGLSVAPQYHGDNVGYQLLLARTPLCLAARVPLTVTAFTGATSQYLAKKAGFHYLAELNYQEYKYNGKLAYPRLNTNAVLMAKEFKSDGN